MKCWSGKRRDLCVACTLQHLRSKKHVNYGNNPANFAMMDKFAEEKGLDWETFVLTITHPPHRSGVSTLTVPIQLQCAP